MISCRKAAKHICENIDEKIDSPLCREIRSHLKKCPECRSKLSSLKKIISLYRKFPRKNPPPSFSRIFAAGMYHSGERKVRS
jgi:hypothetical protein